MALELDMKGFNADKIPGWARVLIVVLIPALVGGAYFYFYFSPKTKEIAGLEKRLSDLQGQIATNETKARRLAVLKEQNQWLEQRLEELKGQLPKESEITELLRSVSEKGRQAGLDIVKWKPGTRRNNPSGLYDEIPVDVSAVGGYHDLGDFFNGITQLRRIVNISGIRMKKEGTSAVVKGKNEGVVQEDLLSVEFKATTFAVSTAPPPEPQGKGKPGKSRGGRR